MNIYLIGMMGSGKSVVGNMLAKIIDMPFVDLDKEIEKKAGKSIAEIFLNDGEIIFRTMESKQLRLIFDSIISCGGGVILNKKNCTFIKQNGSTILLTASIEELSQRLQGSRTRPLLSEKNNLEILADLWLERKSQYLNTADLVIDTDGKTVEKISQEIIKKLNI